MSKSIINVGVDIGNSDSKTPHSTTYSGFTETSAIPYGATEALIFKGVVYVPDIERFPYVKDKTRDSKKEEQRIVKKDKKDGYNKAMEALIYYALNYSNAITLIDNSNVYIPNKDIRIILNEIIAYYNKYGSISEADFYTYLIQKELVNLQEVVKKSLSNDYPTEINDNQVNECLVAIKNYNIALEIKKLEKEINEEVDIAKQMELMDKILKLKTKEGKKEDAAAFAEHVDDAITVEIRELY